MIVFSSNSEFLDFFLIIILIASIGVIEIWLLLKPSGRNKRGFKIWSRRLSKMEYDYLNNPSLYFAKQYWSGKGFAYSFIRVEDNEVIISNAFPVGRTFFPYVGYVDLTEPAPRLQYRSTLILSLLLIFLMFMHPLFIIGLPIFAINFWIETKGLDKFLKYHMNANKVQRRIK